MSCYLVTSLTKHISTDPDILEPVISLLTVPTGIKDVEQTNRNKTG